MTRDDDAVVDVEVRHGGKTAVKTRVVRDALTVEFVTRVTREACEEATRNAPASALTFLGPGGIKFKGNDVGRIDATTAKSNKKGGPCRLRLMLLVSSDEGCATKRTTTGGGSGSRGVEALRAARLAKEAKRSDASTCGSTLSSLKTKQRQRVESWKATGIVGARNEGLDAVPSALFDDDDDDDFRSRIRVLDCAFNVIERLPANQIASLTGLTRLVMRDNALRDADAVPWAAITTLKRLSRVDLSGNALTGLFVGTTTTTNESIQTLTLARNAIEVIPEGFFSGMKGLRHLSLANNRLSALPIDLRRNSALELLDASGNKSIRTIPESFAELKMLQVLDLSDNAIDASGVPSVVLREATSLREIGLRGNPARIEALRELDGWTAFDERRKKRADKALASRVMLGDNIFDEGAAAERFERY